MKVVSLVPHATELLFALGLGDEIIAVTHECDHPPAALGLPHITRDALEPGLSAAEVDTAVRERTAAGQAIYELDTELLVRLDPDLIVTQALCRVCAVAYEDVRALAEEMPSPPRVLSLDPRTFGETLHDVGRVAEATGRRPEGVALVKQAARRIDAVRLAVGDADRPRVAALEWLDPVYVAGHWTPQLVELAGGEDVVGFGGEPSQVASWGHIEQARPDVVVVIPCGYGAQRAYEEAIAHAPELRRLEADRVVALDGGAYFSRPGPRLLDGLELLASVLHPDRVSPPAGTRALSLDLAAEQHRAGAGGHRA